jgi:mannose-1-phosphate guanylyltransferase
MPPAAPSLSDRRPWAVILAGGDGTRLQGLTRRITGDSRPKQFCRFFGGKSLLKQTQERLDAAFRGDRTVFVVTRGHEEFYREDLRRVDPSRIVVQPCNRGTGVAISLALVRILQSETDPLVAIFPSDHYYSDDRAFASTIESTLAYAEHYPTSTILIGAMAQYPEVEYGWIEPGPRIIPPRVVDGRAIPLLRVKRFWEKPSLPEARKLWRGGCLWNTFVTAGHARAILELLPAQIAGIVPMLAAGVSANDLDAAYRGIRAIDFSREVLAPMQHRLLVVRDDASGWVDLGNPGRVIDTLARKQVEEAWLTEMLSDMGRCKPS